MAPDTRPSSDAVLATVTDRAAAEAAIADITDRTGIPADAIAHGTGESFALQLEGSDDETGPATRMGKWLLSLGQEREELIEMGEAARDGEYAIVVNDVEDEASKDAVIAALKAHGGARITHIGKWQSEEVL